MQEADPWLLAATHCAFQLSMILLLPRQEVIRIWDKTCEDHKCRITHFNSNLGNFIKAKKAENVYESPSGYNKYSKKVLSAKWNTAALWGINCFIIILCHSSAVTSSPLQVFKAPCLLNSKPESTSGMVFTLYGDVNEPQRAFFDRYCKCLFKQSSLMSLLAPSGSVWNMPLLLA